VHAAALAVHHSIIIKSASRFVVLPERQGQIILTLPLRKRTVRPSVPNKFTADTPSVPSGNHNRVIFQVSCYF
jgi:hypothetical protein